MRPPNLLLCIAVCISTMFISASDKRALYTEIPPLELGSALATSAHPTTFQLAPLVTQYVLGCIQGVQLLYERQPSVQSAITLGGMKRLELIKRRLHMQCPMYPQEEAFCNVLIKHIEHVRLASKTYKWIERIGTRTPLAAHHRATVGAWHEDNGAAGVDCGALMSSSPVRTLIAPIAHALTEKAHPA